MKAKIDYAFLSLLGILLIITIVDVRTSNYILNITNYLGIIGWSIVLIARILKPHLGRYALAGLIVLGTFNILSFELVRTSVSIGFGSVGMPGVNPTMLLLLVVYYFVNRKSINNKITQIFKGSAQEQGIEHQKMVGFYDTYPDEAQVSLKQLRSKYPQ
jgi:hypothetical protein